MNALSSLQSRSILYAFFSLLLGMLLSLWPHPYVNKIAHELSTLYMNLIKFISVPVIFFSIVSAITQLDCAKKLKSLMSFLVRYTLLTTIIAAFVAMIAYLIFQPVKQVIEVVPGLEQQPLDYISHLSHLVPDNMIKMFVEGNIVSIVICAILIGISAIQVEEKYRETFSHFLQSIFAILMKMAQAIILTLPLVVWAFVLNLVEEVSHQGVATSLFSYFGAILLANLIQAVIVLPMFLRYHGFSVRQTISAAWPAITTAFFAKSSYAAIPASMHCLTEKMGAHKSVVSFSIPLSSTINMNACAAFIYITVLFVAQSYGMEMSMTEMVVWTFVATAAAVGNAGVPMGCFFMSSAILAALNVPTALMGAILPFYALLDMFESGLNIFSDICVTRAVNKNQTVYVSSSKEKVTGTITL